MQGWPDSFDFRTDEVCQGVFKPFIEGELDKLKAYDAQRPPDTAYIFHEHARRVAEDVKKTCLHMNLGETVAENMYWAVLPHDIGKNRLPVSVWDTEEKPDEKLKKLRRTHTLLGAQMVQEYFPDTDHPFKDLMMDIMANHHEQMDGKGTNGVPGEILSLPVRLAAIVEAYDGWRIRRPHFGARDISPPGVLKRMREEKGAAMFDMDLFESFVEMKMAEYNSSSDHINLQRHPGPHCHPGESRDLSDAAHDNQGKYCVYILTSKRYGTLYTGVTSDLVKRVWEHKNKQAEGFTKKYKVNMLVYYERHASAESAIKRGKQIKEWKRQWKIELIEKDNPSWHDLYDGLVKRANV